MSTTHPHSIDASTLIVGFTGPIGSGCSYISEVLPRIALPRKYKYYKMSDILRDRLKSKGNINPNTTDLQNEGNELRKNGNNSALIAMLFEKIDAEPKTDGELGIIIDGIKNVGEIEVLRQFPFFFLVSVHSPQHIRSGRVLGDKKFRDIKEFENADTRDQKEQYEYGQQVSQCSYLSDIIINNETNFPRTSPGERDRYVREIYDKYIKLLENYHDGVKTDRLPTKGELCMTIAYALSKSSSCMKRKVGAVVVDLETMQLDPASAKLEKTEMPFIISSGYNEVPLGSIPCIYNPLYEKCYRDFLQEAFAKNIKHCPSCGLEIKIGEIKCNNCGSVYTEYVKVCKKCHQEIEFVYICPNEKCKSKVFNLFLPGGKGSPGKLLDMCRALHAEETALLKLAERTGKSNHLVLYVTTQPCNLCANKIVLSGIKEVVYSEPYTMIESDEILKKGQVKTQRFQGVKSSAFFKLYH
jgi:deoxycytidylate deaminase